MKVYLPGFESRREQDLMLFIFIWWSPLLLHGQRPDVLIQQSGVQDMWLGVRIGEYTSPMIYEFQTSYNDLPFALRSALYRDEVMMLHSCAMAAWVYS